MKKSSAACTLLFLLAGCTGGDSAATWNQPPTTPGPALPSGLIAVDGDTLRVHDAKTGTVLRTLERPAGRQVTYSPDFRYAATVDRDAGLLTVYTLDGDGYRPSGTLNPAALGGDGLALVNAAFVPGSGRLGVELDGGDGAMRKTVGVDPADPGRVTGDLPGFPSQFTDSTGDPASAEHVAIPSVPAARDVTVHRSARELVDADVIAPDDDGDGVSALLYSCHGPQIAAFTLACRGQGERAELVALTADPQRTDATIRRIGAVKGKPFTDVLVSPDGRQLIARRGDGFYAVPVAGGTPRRLFGPLAGEVIRWN
ncbi:hypothetical protein OHA21_13795 [Actinoplanes sp. NBC_00393]|uniref:hypothetical protein n=1 Tax=Actinoplanes sp. NBC_00393 TaxID=2975953 RepID=UPI002E1D12FD